MFKYIKLHPAATIRTEALPKGSSHKGRSFHWKNFLKRVLIILCLAVVSGITIMAFFSDEILFENLLTGLFIVGCVLFLKGISNEKTNIQRTKRNIN
jgi:hypothetical protein